MPSIESARSTGADKNHKPSLVVTDRDIVFNCPNCHGELVVDREGAGMDLPCSHCGHRLTVPRYQPVATAAPLAVAIAPAPVLTQPAVPVQPTIVSEPTPVLPPKRTFDHGTMDAEGLARRLDELKHQLKENRSQDTEMRGHVNRATIELHRLQLRLKKLEERHGDIQAELTAVLAKLGSEAA